MILKHGSIEIISAIPDGVKRVRANSAKALPELPESLEVLRATQVIEFACDFKIQEGSGWGGTRKALIIQPLAFLGFSVSALWPSLPRSRRYPLHQD